MKIGLGRKPAGEGETAKKPRTPAKDGAAPAKRGPRKKVEAEANAA